MGNLDDLCLLLTMNFKRKVVGFHVWGYSGNAGLLFIIIIIYFLFMEIPVKFKGLGM
jgi:hypothetical protein